MSALTHYDAPSRASAYTRQVWRAMALACYLFPLLYLGSALLFVQNPGTFHPETYEWMGGNDVEQFSLLWLAWFAAIAAMLGVAQLLQAARPRLSLWATIFVFIGGLTQVGWFLQMLQRAALQRIPFATYHTMLLVDQSPVYVWSITVLLWMVGLVMVGIGIWQTNVLPRWVGAMLIIGTGAFFLYQGPGGLLGPNVPLIGNLIAAVVFLIAFSVIGQRLWQYTNLRDA